MTASVSNPDPSRDRFLRAATGEQTDRPPVWMMRQAGRYLPEYRDLRSQYSFREAISTPDVAIDISLQPWERFSPDGVVMFSDILPALELLGFDYHLESGVGPIVDNHITDASAIPDRPRRDPTTHLDYVGEVLSGLGHHLQDQAAVIGFVGGPFTLAAYALEGEPAKSFPAVRRLRWEQPEAFRSLLEQLGDVLVEYARYQVTAGADVIQVFDTYAGLLSRSDIEEFLLPIHRRIMDAIDVHSIAFARNMGGRLDLLARTGADVVSVDWTIDMADARSSLGDRPVQGNLDPSALFASPETIRDRTRSVIEHAGNRGHILNLGHGVHRETPIEGVSTFFETAQTFRH